MTAASLTERIAAAGLDWIVPDWSAPRDVMAFSTSRTVDGAQVSATAQDDAMREAAVRDATAGDALAAALASWLPAPPRWLKQVHGATVHDAYAQAPAAPPRADAIVARAVDVVCAIQTADCLPLLFTDRSGSIVGGAHAGWRGLAAGVIEATLAAMRVEPRDVLAWIGPGIGPRVYQVGADVRDAHCAADAGADACFAPVAPTKWLADLRAIALRRLERAGVASIAGAARCTFSESASFHSFRRDGACAGRMATLIWRAA